MTAFALYVKLFSVMLEEVEEYSLLYDFYGQLLTDKQREFYRMYHEENLSFSEIAEQVGISRQGVFDAVKKAEKALYSFEEKLGLLSEYRSGKGGE